MLVSTCVHRCVEVGIDDKEEASMLILSWKKWQQGAQHPPFFFFFFLGHFKELNHLFLGK